MWTKLTDWYRPSSTLTNMEWCVLPIGNLEAKPLSQIRSKWPNTLTQNCDYLQHFDFAFTEEIKAEVGSFVPIIK